MRAVNDTKDNDTVATIAGRRRKRCTGPKRCPNAGANLTGHRW